MCVDSLAVGFVVDCSDWALGGFPHCCLDKCADSASLQIKPRLSYSQDFLPGTKYGVSGLTLCDR